MAWIDRKQANTRMLHVYWDSNIEGSFGAGRVDLPSAHFIPLPSRVRYGRTLGHVSDVYKAVQHRSYEKKWKRQKPATLNLRI